MVISADWVSAGTAVLALVASAGAWWTAHYARRTGEQAAEISAQMTEIERRRLQADFEPVFDIECRIAGSTFLMFVRLEGPTAIEKLTSVQLVIRDSRIRRLPSVGDEDYRAELATVIWGPLRFRPGIDGATEERRSGTFELPVDETHLLSLEWAAPPSWYRLEDWMEEQIGAKLRLTIHCEAEGYEPWHIPVEVDVDSRLREEA